MQAILWKIISAIMSVVFFISGFIPGSNINEPKPVENIKVFDDIPSAFACEEDCVIFSSYDEWDGFLEKTGYTNERDEFISSVGESFFKENNLVLIEVGLPDTSYMTKVISAVQQGNTLSVELIPLSVDLFGFTILCYSEVFITTSKLVTKVKVTELDSMVIPFILDGSMEDHFSIVDTEIHGLTEEFSGYTNVFSDFEGWKEFLDSGKYEFEEYADTIDEKYFEIKNLVAVIVSKNAREETRIEYPDIKDDNIMIDYYLVSQPGIYPDNITYQTIFVETNKNISTVTATLKDPNFSVPFVLD